MTFKVDTAKCSGIGLCEMTAAAVFEVGDDGQAHVVEPDPPASDLVLAEEAVANCPTGALSFDG